MSNVTEKNKKEFTIANKGHAPIKRRPEDYNEKENCKT